MLFLLFSCKSHPLKREERLKLYCLFVLTLRAWLWVYRAEGHTSILLVTISLFFQLQPSRPSLPSSSHSHLSSTCYSKPLISIILGVALTKPGLIYPCPTPVSHRNQSFEFREIQNSSRYPLLRRLWVPRELIPTGHQKRVYVCLLPSLRCTPSC